jgi:hypothetical protein
MILPCRKYKASIDTPGGHRTCLQVAVQRDGNWSGVCAA